MNIAISGYKGFIGYHIYNSLIYKYGFKKHNIKLITRLDFNDYKKLNKKLENSHIILHFAGINRNNNEEFIYNENIRLCKSLIESSSGKNRCLIFASSIHQDSNSSFGKSKLKCKALFSKWAKDNKKTFINLKIPNVFGPFCKPNYNSFVSTFCNNLVHKVKCNIIEDNSIDLLYVEDLVCSIADIIKAQKKDSNKYAIDEIIKFRNQKKIKVSKVYQILKRQLSFYNKNVIPSLNNKFEKNLFNTLRSHINLKKIYPKSLTKHTDERGFFSEVIRSNGKGQFSMSTTFKDIVRGNHFHTRKIERFIVIDGKALVELRKIGSQKKYSFYLDGNNLDYIDIPVWFTHNIKNVGDKILTTLFWINEPYDHEDPDTYYVNV